MQEETDENILDLEHIMIKVANCTQLYFCIAFIKKLEVYTNYFPKQNLWKSYT